MPRNEYDSVWGCSDAQNCTTYCTADIHGWGFCEGELFADE
jgi:succinate dehydrogenase/fumarate reductase-like Fe-S protein